jgi:hypothetical protein
MVDDSYAHRVSHCSTKAIIIICTCLLNHVLLSLVFPAGSAVEQPALGYGGAMGGPILQGMLRRYYFNSMAGFCWHLSIRV